MKSAFFLLFLVVLSVSNSPFSSAAEAPNPVLDAKGKIVRSGARYYICPVYPSTGGLTLESLDNKPCPLDIVQEDQVPGLPVSFYPINLKKGVVRVSTDLNVEFPTACKTKCPNSNWWTFDVCPATKNYFLSTGGQLGNPGPNTIRNWFKIEPYGPGLYKFLYCPTFSKVDCKYVGIVVQNGKRRLALSDVPMKFVLKQA
ncbi:OLC1v1013949C1 [Oldenlandia corymbosa var. corymbosa]|uniref:OLC1v1013949C1 n=1 Tax=Oldenlandia corymbosa var. corymbosa TaxID=529605 RepID=A0AAV1DZH9_OLDCO|nr:OLC1v1013949C1 [Oldenlandia corymbosa var. corymbosa]